MDCAERSVLAQYDSYTFVAVLEYVMWNYFIARERGEGEREREWRESLLISTVSVYFTKRLQEVLVQGQESLSQWQATLCGGKVRQR